MHPHLKKQWCIEKLDAEFICRMERVLDIYELPYDAKHPVVCFDERPCQLLDGVMIPIAMKPGQIQREDYQYVRKGTCELLCAVEPLAGRRTLEVSARKTKKDYARFLKRLATKTYAEAQQIILVHDNLSTHSLSALYETYAPEEARRLSQKFQLVYTPKHASWLNMAEIELSAIAKQCLDRRIGSMNTLSAEVAALTKKRNKKKIKITWSFTTTNARKKFQRAYLKLRN